MAICQMRATGELRPLSPQPETPTATTLPNILADATPSSHASADLLALQTQVQVPDTNTISHVIEAMPMPISVCTPFLESLYFPHLVMRQNESIDPQLRMPTAEDLPPHGTDSESGYGSDMDDADDGDDADADLATGTTTGKSTEGSNKGKAKKPTALDPFLGHVDGLGRGNSALGMSLTSNFIPVAESALVLHRRRPLRPVLSDAAKSSKRFHRLIVDIVRRVCGSSYYLWIWLLTSPSSARQFQQRPDVGCIWQRNM